MQNDFPDEILNCVAHRPWPMPEEPWIMTQSWHDLLFAHWPVDKRLLREKVPAGLELDLFDHQAWLGVVPFRMTNVAPRGVPALPWVSAFNELNVRTYVHMHERPGIYFFSLDADSSLAVAAARTLFGLPYFSAEMQVQHDRDWVYHRSRRHSSDNDRAEWDARYRASGAVHHARPGTLEYFLTERYCLYTVDESFRAHRLEIHHPPWPLQQADAEITVNTMAEAAGLALPAMPPIVHCAARQDVVAWRPTRVT